MTEGVPDERPSQDKCGTAQRNICSNQENQEARKSCITNGNPQF
jgi:hypothetical protein